MADLLSPLPASSTPSPVEQPLVNQPISSAPLSQPSPPKRTSRLGSFFKNHRTFLGVLVLLVSLIAGAGLFTAMQLSQDDRSKAATGELILAFDESTLDLQPGQERTIQLTVNTGGMALSAVVIPLQFDPSNVTITSLTQRESLPVTLENATIDNAAGRAQITLGANPGAPFNGSGVIAQMTIKASQTPTTGTTIQYDASKVQAAVVGRDDNVAQLGAPLQISVTAPISDSCSSCLAGGNRYVCPNVQCDDTGNCNTLAPFCSQTADNAENGGGVVCQYCGEPATPTPTATPTAVPTAEPTTTPTAEPTAVPTPVPGDPALSVQFKLQGLKKAGIVIPAEITVKYTPASGTPIIKSFTKNYLSGETGVLAENTPLGIAGFDFSATQGVAENVEIFVKTPTSLRKKLGAVTLKNNEVATLHTETVLPVGDFKRGEGEINLIKLNDLALALTQYNELENPITDANKEYDVNFDNIYTLQDIAIVLTNFEELEYPGDSP